MLDRMDARFQQDDEHWTQVSENFDLLFARVESLGVNQARLESQMNLGNQVMEQILKDQQTLAKQIEVTGDAVARLTLNRQFVPESEEPPPTPTHPQGSPPRSFHQYRPPPHVISARAPPHGNRFRREPLGFSGHRHVTPKMACPTFDGSNPRIWKSKCLDYFELCNIDEAFWATAAALNMDGNAAKWLQVYKKQHGLGDWNTFISAVEKKFGANDYRDAMSELLELKQTDTVEEYARAFENLQFEISMYNDGFDDTFFVSQFVKGLKLDISAGVRAQVPKDVDEAILLAKVQQQVLEKGKHKWSKAAASTKFQSSTSKGEGKTGPQPSTMWKERQTLNYRKANNLCYYCGEKYDPNHAAICAQRPKAQLNALVTNPLDMPLSEEVVAQLELEDSLASEFCQLSLNALAGTAHGDVMQIQALVQNKTMLTLIDTGSSHSFVSAAFLDTVGIKPVPTVPRQVKLANGQVLQSDLWVPNMPWFCNGHTHADMRVIDITTFDAILGYD